RLGLVLALGFRRQALVFLPLLLHLFLLVRRQRAHRLVLLARDTALVRRQLRPRPHLLLDAGLLLRGHFRVPLGDAAPLLLALGVELVPVGRERSQDLPLGSRQVIPRRRSHTERLRKNACGREGRKRQANDEDSR